MIFKKLLIGTVFVGGMLLSSQNVGIAQRNISFYDSSLENLVKSCSNVSDIFKPNFVENKIVPVLDGSRINVDIAFNGREFYVPNDINPYDLTILRSDSKLLDVYFAGVEGYRDIAKRYVKKIVFSPEVVNSKGIETNGLDLGGGVIFIDTVASNGIIKNPKLRVPLIVHEADHEMNVGKKLPTLILEELAYRRQFEVLEALIKIDSDPILLADYCLAQKRLETIDYLKKLKSFSMVYPNEFILARDLLRPGISKEVVDEYFLEDVSDLKGLDKEFYSAIFVIKNIYGKKREDAINRLYEIYQNSKDDYIRVNVASVLIQMAPNVCKIPVSRGGDIAYSKKRSVYFNLNSDFNKGENRIGRAYVSKEIIDVENMPPLEDLIADRN